MAYERRRRRGDSLDSTGAFSSAMKRIDYRLTAAVLIQEASYPSRTGLRDPGSFHAVGEGCASLVSLSQFGTYMRRQVTASTEIERAFKILADYQAASGGGAGAYGLVDEDGSSSMIDAPMVR